MLSGRLYLLPGILATFFAYKIFNGDNSSVLPLAICVIIMVIIYVTSPSLDYWYMKRHPKPPSPALKRPFLSRSFFQKYTPEEQTLFFERLQSFMFGGADFQPEGLEGVPEDIKVMISTQAVRLTLYKSTETLAPFEKVIIYGHPFPSPQYPKQLHNSEIYAEDGVLLFAIQPLVQHFMHPQTVFNIALYEWSKVMRLVYPTSDLPIWTAADWPHIEFFLNMSREQIEQTVGLQNLDMDALGMCAYMDAREAFAARRPNDVSAYDRYLH